MTPKNKWLVGSVSAVLITAVMHLEGRRNVPYLDVVNVWTVCDGYAQKDVVRDKTYSDAECDDMTKTQLEAHGRAMLECVNVPISPNEYAAYTLFSYNVGSGAFCRSSLLRKLNQDDHVGACNGLMEWNKAGGKVVRGLTIRREFERKLCLKPKDENESV